MAAVAVKTAVLKNVDGFEEVAARVKPSAEAAWDIPSGSIVELIEEWIECEFDGKRGFIKAKNLPNVETKNAGELVDVLDSYKDNDATCMRRHAEQDSSAGNVLCYVANGPDAVKLVESWVECRWRGYRNFVKARHVQPSVGIVSAEDLLEGGLDVGSKCSASKVAPVARGMAGGSSSSSSTAPAGPAARGASKVVAETADGSDAIEPSPKKAKLEHASPLRPRCKYGKGCYQKNPAHRTKFCHPGDADWEQETSDVVEAASEPLKEMEEEVKPAEPVAATEDVPMPPVPPPDSPPEPAVVEATSPPTVVTEVIPAAIPSSDKPPVKEQESEVAKVGETRDCDCCYDNVPTTGGVACPGKAHFFCAACLANFLVAFQTADYADQKKGKGRALCPMKDSDVAFGDAALAAFVPQEVFDEYLHIRIKVAEKVIQEQFEKENAAKIEELKEKLAKASGEGEQLELDKHRLHIIDNIFTLKCPRCSLAFFDYDGCCALTCGGCKCGFCSYCLEDCGADAHKHFYDNGHKCPNEGGQIFILQKQWQEHQSVRKARILCEYLATIPEAQRKKVADLCAPDAKDLGIEMPKDFSGKALDPEAHGISRFKLQIPRRFRPLLIDKQKLLKETVELTCPDPASKVRVFVPHGTVVLRKEPSVKLSLTKNTAARLTDGHEVTIDDDWLEVVYPALTGAKSTGFIKTKHCNGLFELAAHFELAGKVKVKEANGHGSVLIRKEATQDEGKNSLGYVEDGEEVQAVRHWLECTFKPKAFGAGKKGFLEVGSIPEDDVILKCATEDADEALALLKKELKVDFKVTPVGKKHIPAPKAAAARGRGRGRG